MNPEAYIDLVWTLEISSLKLVPIFAKGYTLETSCVSLLMSTAENSLSANNLGGDKVRYEPDNPKDFKKHIVVWSYCVEDEVTEFMESLADHDGPLNLI